MLLHSTTTLQKEIEEQLHLFDLEGITVTSEDVRKAKKLCKNLSKEDAIFLTITDLLKKQKTEDNTYVLSNCR